MKFDIAGTVAFYGRVVLLTLAVSLGVCCISTSFGPNSSFNPQVKRDDAIRIAVDFSKSDYTMDSYDAVVFENETSWTVNFVFKRKYGNRVGGGPAVEVDKKTGEVLRHYFAR